MKTRSLKIEEAGDFCRGKITPKIRLSGLCLERAVFRPGHRAEGTISQSGIITLRFVNQSTA